MYMLWRMTLCRCSNCRVWVRLFFLILFAAICYYCCWTRERRFIFIFRIYLYVCVVPIVLLFVTIVSKKNVNTNNEKWYKWIAYKDRKWRAHTENMVTAHSLIFPFPYSDCCHRSYSLSLALSLSSWHSLFILVLCILYLTDFLYWRVQFKFYFEITHIKQTIFLSTKSVLGDLYRVLGLFRSIELPVLHAL